MDNLQFEWDKEKARINLAKHKVSFEEAATVFWDENAIEYYDPDHSDEEDRFILLGVSSKIRELVVCHCHRKNGNTIRIYSARKATRAERKSYQKGEYL
jgi:uncharacterized protein